MGRVFFTADDLARTRIVASYGPYAEALFSLGVLARSRRNGVLFGGWHRQLPDAAGRWTGLVGELVGKAPVLDLFTLLGPVGSAPEATEALLGLERRWLRTEVEAAAGWAAAHQVGAASRLPAWAFRLPDDREVRAAFAAAMRSCHDAAVAPHWNRIRAHLSAEIALRGRVMAQGGVEALLSSLYPGLRWSGGILHSKDWPAVDLHLDGRGLTLVPSVFCQRATVYVSLTDPDRPATLFYPALRDVSDAYRLWTRGQPGSSGQALVSLLGSTRAAALEIVAGGCTTTELATRLGVTPPTASYHLAALRNAGLITTRRLGGAALHAATPLGLALLNADGIRPPT